MHKRIRREKRIVEKMIHLYCAENHHTTSLCDSCFELQEYAFKRLLNCPFEEDKPVCSKCRIHCYRTKEKEKIKIVMRYAGPKMILKSPIDTILYFYTKLRFKNQLIR